MEKTRAISELPRYNAVHINDDPIDIPLRMKLEEKKNRFIKRYGIFLVCMCLWTISMICEGAIVAHNTEKSVKAEMAVEYARQLEQYKREQAEAEQAAHWLSGDASREAAINQAVDAAARLAAKMSNDTQKGGIICNALARVLNKSYPNSLQEVIDQPQQWMFYSEDNTFTEHDREVAERIIRPWMEQGVIPSGLTAEMVYGEWTPTDYVLRDMWEKTSSAHYWRYAT